MPVKISQSRIGILGTVFLLAILFVVPTQAQTTTTEIPQERIGSPNAPYQDPLVATPEETEADVYLNIALAEEQIEAGESVELTITLTNQNPVEAGQHHLYIHIGDQLEIETTPSLAFNPTHNIYTTTLASLAGDSTQSITLLLENNETADGLQTITVYSQDTIYQYPQRQAVEYLLVGSGSTAMLESTTQEEYPGWQPRFLEPTTSLFSGAASFSYPFEVPPGRNGLQPNLGLNYNSRQTDSTLGWSHSGEIAEGWSLNGIPSIVRNDITYCPYGNYEWILVKNDFSLILNGATYDLVETTPNQTYGQYEAEGEPSLYVERRNDIIPGNGSSANVTGEYWLVRTPDGTEYQFGYTADAEQIIYRTVGVNTPGGGDGQGCGNDPYIGRHKNTAVYRWWLNKTTDSHNNQLTVDYLQEDILLATNDGCGEGICREIAAYPANIWYNNTSAGNWASHIQFNYENYGIGQRVSDGFPLFETAKSLTRLDMRQNTSTGWQTVWSYHLEKKEYNGESEPKIAHGLDDAIHSLTSITQKDAQNNTTLPPTTFTYLIQESARIVDGTPCDPGNPFLLCDLKFIYPYLHTVDNGYGGIHEFEYSQIDPNDGVERYSYRVTKLRSWDGVETIYGTTNPTRRLEYAADHTAALYKDYKLVGFPLVTVHTYEGETTTPLHISQTEFHTIDNDLWRGKQKYVRTLSPTPGNNERRLSQTYYNWTDDAGNCPQTGLEQDDFVCLHETISTQYYYPTSGSDVTTQTRTENHYELIPQGNRQWGFVTRQDLSYKGPFDASDVTYQHNTTAYATKITADKWLALPWMQGTFSADWNAILTYNMFLYDGETDPDGQDLTNGHLTMSRALLTDNDLDGTSSGLHFKTVDTTITYDPYGNVETTSTYADYGEVTGVAGVDWTWGSAAGDNSTAYTSTSQYTNFGLQLDWMENPLDQRTSYPSYHSRFTWLPTQITDANGLATHLAYDDSMRLTAVAGPGDDINSNPTTEYVYDLSGTPIRLDAIIQPNEPDLRQETSQYYNGLGQVLQTTSRDHAVAGQGQRDLISTVSYDALGRPVCQSVPFTTSPSSGYQGVDACSVAHSATVYDTERGGVKQSIAPDGSATTRYFSMPGWLANRVNEGAYQELFVNANGEETWHTYNALGQLIFVGQKNIGGPCNELQLTEYDYDGNNNLTNVTRNGRICGTTYENPNPVTTSMSYDALGRKLNMSDPDMGQWNYTYDSSGNLTRQEDAEQNALCFTYDGLNRLTRKAQDPSFTTPCPATLASSGANHLATYTYDSQPNGEGQPATISWGANPTEDNDTFVYDTFGRLASQTRLVDDHPFTLATLSYDGLHRPLTVRYPDGEEVTLSYDSEGAETLAAGVDTLVTGLTFNERGQVVARTLGNSVTTNYDYYGATGSNGNNNFRLSAITVKRGSQELRQFEYAYDALGNITRMVTTENGQTSQLDIQDFTYDKLSRLKTAVGGGGFLPAYSYSYNYDRLGNLIQRGSTTYNYTVGDQPHAVDSLSDGSSFTYDANGNMTTREDTTGDFDQAFDVENRLSSVTNVTSNKTTTFEYDASGQRVLTTLPNNHRIYTPFSNYQETHIPESTWGGIGSALEYPPGSVIRRSTYYLDGQAVTQRQHKPVYGDTFEDQQAQGWIPESGTWEIQGYFDDWIYWQKRTSGDHHSSRYVNQSGAMSYEWDINFVASAGSNNQVKASFFFYSDTPDFDNAYMVSQKPDALYMIEWIGGQWYTRLKDTSATAVNGASYDYQATYDPTTGTIQVYRDGELSLTWTDDDAPLTSGSYIGLRTINTRARFDDIQANRVSLSYLHSDHLGSNSLMTDATGTILPNSQAAYLPFGDWRNEPNTNDLTDVGYTGHRHNNTASNDLGLIYMNARYYVPSVGRFASADTITPNPNDSQTYNKYSYVNNAPTKYTDPSGHCVASQCEAWVSNYGPDSDELAVDQSESTAIYTGPQEFSDWYEGEYSGCFMCHGAKSSPYTVLTNDELADVYRNMIDENAEHHLVMGSAMIVMGAISAPQFVRAIGTGACADLDCTNEMSALQQQARSVRQSGVGGSIAARRNIATANINIGGIRDNLVSVSGPARFGAVPNPVSRFFTTSPGRAFDTEVKILEYIARVFQNNPNVSGTIRLYTERQPCPSCLEVTRQFMEMYPNIVITIGYGPQ